MKLSTCTLTVSWRSRRSDLVVVVVVDASPLTASGSTEAEVPRALPRRDFGVAILRGVETAFFDGETDRRLRSVVTAFLDGDTDRRLRSRVLRRPTFFSDLGERDGAPFVTFPRR